MDIKQLILKKLSKQKTIKASDVIKQTGFSRNYINRFFKELQKEGKIILLGKANSARYVLVKNAKEAQKSMLNFSRILKNKELSEDIVLEEVKKNTGIFFGLSKTIAIILDYAFTEMLNNAIEHSRSARIKIKIKKEKKEISFEVIDFGVGIFKHVMKKKKLKSELEAIQDILKGKQTTAPKEHSGEGIFFTSKAADMMTISGSNKAVIFQNIIDDVFIKDIKKIRGTEVRFNISLSSKRRLSDIFHQYSGDSYKFNKTKARVKLYKIGTDYVSRSQARRILSGLEKFKTIIFDFADVETVGQGFADEIFRVWKLHHPSIEIITKNANDNIQFMINRALAK